MNYIKVTERDFVKVNNLLGIRQEKIINPSLFCLEDRRLVFEQECPFATKIEHEGAYLLDKTALKHLIDQEISKCELLLHNLKEGKKLATYTSIFNEIQSENAKQNAEDFLKEQKLAKLEKSKDCTDNKDQDIRQKATKDPIVIKKAYFGDASVQIDEHKKKLEHLRSLFEVKKTGLTDILLCIQKTFTTTIVWALTCTSVIKGIANMITFIFQASAILIMSITKKVGEITVMRTETQKNLQEKMTKIQNYRFFEQTAENVLRELTCQGKRPVMLCNVDSLEVIEQMYENNNIIVNTTRSIYTKDQLKDLQALSSKLNGLLSCKCAATDSDVCQCGLNLRGTLKQIGEVLQANENEILRKVESKAKTTEVLELKEQTKYKMPEDKIIIDLLQEKVSEIANKFKNKEKINEKEKAIIKMIKKAGLLADQSLQTKDDNTLQLEMDFLQEEVSNIKQKVGQCVMIN